MISAEAPTRREVVEGLARELEAGGIESSRLEAERLVAFTLGVERSVFQLELDRSLTAEEAGRLARAVRRRLSGEPLQHIEGTVDFRELTLLADARALIPRPETEQLVEKVLRWALERAEMGHTTPGNAAQLCKGASSGVIRLRRDRTSSVKPLLRSALDVGTGSGAIALSLAVEGIAARVVGIDISREALTQAMENRVNAGLSAERVELRRVEGPLWSAVGSDERFDLIVANPPYVSNAEMDRLPSEIIEREPELALLGGPDGLDVIREIVGAAAGHLTPDGALFLEVGASQGLAVRALLERSGEWEGIEVMADLAGSDRFVRAESLEEARDDHRSFNLP